MMYKRENQNAPIERVKNLFYRRIFIYLRLRVCKANIIRRTERNGANKTIEIVRIVYVEMQPEESYCCI